MSAFLLLFYAVAVHISLCAGFVDARKMAANSIAVTLCVGEEMYTIDN
jgi:hypothetical protein